MSIEISLQEASQLEKLGLIKQAIAKTVYHRGVGVLKFFTEDGREVNPDELIVQKSTSSTYVTYYYMTAPREAVERELLRIREEITKREEEEKRRQQIYEEERRRKVLELWGKVLEVAESLPRPRKPREGHEKRFIRWLERILKETKEYHEMLRKIEVMLNPKELERLGIDLDSVPRYGLTKQYSRPVTYGYVYYWDPWARKYLIIAKAYYSKKTGEPGISAGDLIFQYSDKIP
ncbi:MAG: hypothetical protein QXW42_04340 [Thermofilum sp.]